jgi:hypothetical protein
LNGTVFTNSDSESESESSNLQVEVGDYIAVDGKKVYVVSAIDANGTVRCVSPTCPVNEPVVMTLQQANHLIRTTLK